MVEKIGGRVPPVERAIRPGKPREKTPEERRAEEEARRREAEKRRCEEVAKKRGGVDTEI